jgi:hypothetical protein
MSPAAACSGTDSHRDFYTAIAEAVMWDVYCAVLPAGWFLEKGSYRLSGAGRLEVTYKGPGERRLQIQAGAFCQEEGDCIPDGQDVGAASFGALEGSLVAVEDGSWAIVVGRGARLGWLAIGTGVDEATMRRLAADLVLVGG